MSATDEPKKKKPGYFETVNYMLRTEEEKASGVTSQPAPPAPLSMKHIVWGVFLGLWAFSLTAGAVYYVLIH